MNEVTPGEKIYNIDDLLRILGGDTTYNEDAYSHIRSRFVDEAHHGYCRKIVEYIQNDMKISHMTQCSLKRIVLWR